MVTKSKEVAAVEPLRYLKIPEAAERMRVCTSTIYALCHLLDFPAVKIGNKWLIRQDLLDKWWLDQWEEKSQYFKR